MRYERDSLSTAAAIVREGIRGCTGFAAARERVLTRCVEKLQNATPTTLRALGGLSEVLRAEIEALGPEYRVDLGSKMFPMTVVDALAGYEVPALRFELQRDLAFGRPKP